jgi:hypothetical protein
MRSSFISSLNLLNVIGNIIFQEWTKIHCLLGTKAENLTVKHTTVQHDGRKPTIFFRHTPNKKKLSSKTVIIRYADTET